VTPRDAAHLVRLCFSHTWPGWTLVGTMSAGPPRTWHPNRNPELPLRVGYAGRLFLQTHRPCPCRDCWFLERPFQLRLYVQARHMRREKKQMPEASVSLCLTLSDVDQNAGYVALSLASCLKDKNLVERRLHEVISAGVRSHDALQKMAATGQQASFSVAPGRQHSKVHSVGQPGLRLVRQIVVDAQEHDAFAAKNWHLADVARPDAAGLGKDTFLLLLYSVMFFKIICSDQGKLQPVGRPGYSENAKLL
jgi:hypothetical protein